MRVLPNTFAPPGALARWERELAAVVRWAGPDAVASHTSAAHLFGLDLPGAVAFEVTVPRDRRPRSNERATVHRAAVPNGERRIVQGVPCTSLAWTVLTLASVLDGSRALAVLAESAWRRSRRDFRNSLEHLIQEHAQGRRGIRNLEAVLADCRLRARPLRSALEVEIWRFLKANEMVLPLPETGFDVFDEEGRMEIDFAWPDRKVALEAEGRGPHFGQMVEDSRRGARLAALGWSVVYWPERLFRDEREDMLGRLVMTYRRRTPH